MMRSGTMLLVICGLAMLASVKSAHAYDWNAQMRERQGLHEEKEAIRKREEARNAPLHLRKQLMDKYNQERVNAMVKTAKARSQQGKSNWGTRYRGLQYK